MGSSVPPHGLRTATDIFHAPMMRKHSCLNSARRTKEVPCPASDAGELPTSCMQGSPEASVLIGHCTIRFTIQRPQGHEDWDHSHLSDDYCASMSFIHQAPSAGAVAQGHWYSSSDLPPTMAVSPASESSRDSDSHSASNYSPTPSPITPDHNADSTTAPARGPKAGRTPSRYDWSKHMGTIKRLYIDEDKTLKEVLEIMERGHNFVATPRMVKTRLKKWGYSKNVSVKSEEIEPLMEMIFDAERQGDVRRTATEVTLAGGRVVGLDRVAAHLRRKRIPTNVVQKAQLTLARGGGHGQQPLPPGPWSLDAPDVFRLPESIFADIRGYVYARSGDPGAVNMVRTSTKEGIQTLDLVIAARNFFAQDRLTEALALLRLAPARIKQLMASNLETIPRSLFLLFINLLYVQDAERLNESVRALVRFVAAVVTDASSQWPSQHPLRRIFTSLSQADDQSLADIVLRCYKCLLSSYESLDGASLRGDTVAAWLDLGDVAGFDAIPLAYLEHSLQKTYEAKLASIASGEEAQQPFQQLFYMAELERQKVKALGTPTTRLKELFSMTLQACYGNPSREALTAELNCHYYLADIYKKEGYRELAENHMRMTIEQCERIGSEATAARITTELQDWLQEWGENSKAEEVQGEVVRQMNSLVLGSPTE